MTQELQDNEPENHIQLLQFYGFSIQNSAHQWVFDWASQLNSKDQQDNFLQLLKNELSYTAHAYFMAHPQQPAIGMDYVYLIKKIYDVDDSKAALFKTIIHEAALAHPAFVAGPSTQSSPSILVNQLLIAMVNANFDGYQVVHSKSQAELITVDKTYNLSLLLDHTDFTQLQFNADFLDQLMSYFPISANNIKHKEKHNIFKELHPVLLEVLSIYTFSFNPVNSFIRRRNLHYKQEESLNLIFLRVCITAYAAVQLNLTLDNPKVLTDEKVILNKIQQYATQHFDPLLSTDISFIDQINSEEDYQKTLNSALNKAILTQEDYDFMSSKFTLLCPLLGGYPFLYRNELTLPADEILRRENLTAFRLTANTSTTINREVLIHGFKAPLKIELPGPRGLTITELSHKAEEEELLLPAGTYVHFNIGNQAQIIRPFNDDSLYMLNKILDDVYRQYFSSGTYADSNLSQAHRVMTFIPLVIAYLSAHSNNADMRTLSQTMPTDLRQFLQIAAVFQLTGKATEPSHAGASGKSLQDNILSAKNFLTYIHDENILTQAVDRALYIDRMNELITHFGKSDYATINPEQAEKTIRQNLSIILSLASMLSQFNKLEQQQLQVVDLLIKPSDMQKDDWHALLNYASQLSALHGYSSAFHITLDGKFAPPLKAQYIPYINNAVCELLYISETIALPVINMIHLSPDQLQQRWQEHALNDAFEHHFNIAYKDYSDALQIGDYIVQRPNHGLAHAYRVMVYIPVLINYFSVYSKNEALKKFGETVSPEIVQWLQLASIFSISGRESEISFSSDPIRYEQFKQASVHNFNAYLKRAHWFFDTPDKTQHIERMAEVIYFMGNPKYHEMISPELDEAEKELRINLYYTLTIAHKLDLPRCYGFYNFQKSMELCDTLSINSPLQRASWNRILHYATDLINAQGDGLLFKVNLQGEVNQEGWRYRDHYGEASQSLNKLIECSSSIIAPDFALTSIGASDSTYKTSRFFKEPSLPSEDLTSLKLENGK